MKLTDADYDALSACLQLEPPTPNAPMYYVGGIDEVVESIVTARMAQALRDAADQIENTGALTETVVKYLRLRADKYDAGEEA